MKKTNRSKRAGANESVLLSNGRVWDPNSLLTQGDLDSGLDYDNSHREVLVRRPGVTPDGVVITGAHSSYRVSGR